MCHHIPSFDVLNRKQFFFFFLYQDPNVLRKAQGLNAQAKGEVQILISGRGRAIQAKGEVLMGGGQ